MLHPLVWWGLVYYVIGVLAYIAGHRQVAGMNYRIGRTLLFVFLSLATIFCIVGFICAHPM